MSDEDKKKEEGSGTDTDVKVSEAEHQQLMADKAELEELKQQAELAGYRTVKEFADDGELHILDAQEKAAEAEKAKPTVKTEDKKPDVKVIDHSAEIAELKKQQDENAAASKELAVSSLLTSQETAFKQSNPDTKLDFAKAKKRIMSQQEGMLISHIAKTQTDGNYYAAVNFLENLDKKASDLRQEGAAAEAAKQKAEQTADTSTGHIIKTDDDKELTDQQKHANIIAPDEEYHFAG